MKFTSTPKHLLRAIAILPVLALGACEESAADGDDGAACPGGKCDAPTDPKDFACKNVVDKSGRGRPNVLAELTDPISQLVLRGGKSCPTSYRDVVAKLRTEDVKGCEGGGGAGMSSRAVTETGQYDGGKLLQFFRTVTTRRCNGRQDFEVLFSLFGPTKQALPSNVEVMAFDAEAKEFNYYTIEGSKWIFHGSSSDFTEGRSKERCGGCHTGGGMVMKELDTPWANWTGHFQTPGATELVNAFKDDLGNESSGADMESLTNAGNRAWTKTRVTRALDPSKGTPADLLRPLFCTVEFNLDTASDFETSPVSGIPVDMLVDPQFKGFGSIGMKDDVYQAARTAAGYTVPELGKTDTFFKFMFVERSKADNMYVDELKSQGVIDADFVKDVLAIDMTRPVFSDERCALLEFAPTFAQLGVGAGGGEDTGTGEGGSSSEGGGSSDGGSSGGDGGSSDGGTSGGGPVGAGNCCTADAARKGCENPEVEACVCTGTVGDSFCCDGNWDATCVMEAVQQCAASCPMGVGEDDEPMLTAGPRASAATDAASIRAAFIANLEQANPAPDSAAAQLLTSLEDTSDASAHDARVASFLKACEDRDERALMDDLFRIVTWQRDIAYGHPVMEFQETMAKTKLQVPSSLRLDPTTCEAK